MFSIYDGRKEFYQWDFDQMLLVADKDITEVHYSTATSQEALVMECKELEGEWVVEVPNSLLMEGRTIKAYGFIDGTTVAEETFEVVGRAKPADYIYNNSDIDKFATEPDYTLIKTESRTSTTKSMSITDLDTNKMIAILEARLSNNTSQTTATSGQVSIVVYDTNNVLIADFTMSLLTGSTRKVNIVCEPHYGMSFVECSYQQNNQAGTVSRVIIAQNKRVGKLVISTDNGAQYLYSPKITIYGDKKK